MVSKKALKIKKHRLHAWLLLLIARRRLLTVIVTNVIVIVVSFLGIICDWHASSPMQNANDADDCNMHPRTEPSFDSRAFHTRRK